ncbi:MAG TPA: sigma 54-interacting transcriptional regulator [Polyangiaceae bacterium]|jgi:two-component system response regulator HydG|nr:sigma 54-interacting transcriptional regulator [Polyangiaceae bacterium]
MNAHASDRVIVTGELKVEAERIQRALLERGFAATSRSVAELESERVTTSGIVVAAGSDPIEDCRKLSIQQPGATVIVVDRTPNLSRTLAALRAGAADYVTDANDIAAVEAAIRRIVDRQALRERVEFLRSTDETKTGTSVPLLGDSAAARRLRAKVERLRGSNGTVLLAGERGTGKATVARLLHQGGARATEPFLTLDCSVLPEHALEAELFGTAQDGDRAEGGVLRRVGRGTLYLTAIDAMTLPTQAQLFRALALGGPGLAEREPGARFEGRLMAATRFDLAEATARGRFREDLFLALREGHVRLSPLRERGLDSLVLAQYFVRHFAKASGKNVVGMTVGAARTVLTYSFPGNVRELRNAIEAAVALARHDHVTDMELSLHLRDGGAHTALGRAEESSSLSWGSLEAKHIADVLKQANGNKAQAARLLGIDRKTLYRKLRRYASLARELGDGSDDEQL